MAGLQIVVDGCGFQKFPDNELIHRVGKLIVGVYMFVWHVIATIVSITIIIVMIIMSRIEAILTVWTRVVVVKAIRIGIPSATFESGTPM